jgi:hypothetical protein
MIRNVFCSVIDIRKPVFGLVVGIFYVFVNLKLAIVGETKVVLSSLFESE